MRHISSFPLTDSTAEPQKLKRDKYLWPATTHDPSPVCLSRIAICSIWCFLYLQHKHSHLLIWACWWDTFNETQVLTSILVPLFCVTLLPWLVWSNYRSLKPRILSFKVNWLGMLSGKTTDGWILVRPRPNLCKWSMSSQSTALVNQISQLYSGNSCLDLPRYVDILDLGSAQSVMIGIALCAKLV